MVTGGGFFGNMFGAGLGTLLMIVAILMMFISSIVYASSDKSSKWHTFGELGLGSAIALGGLSAYLIAKI